jgi:hypothetical protein
MIIEAILKINPNAIVSIVGNDINTCKITWHNGTTPIPKADIQAKMVEVQAEYDAKQYQRDREVEYNKKSAGEQFDMMYWDQVNNTTTWKDWISSIKSSIPKE